MKEYASIAIGLGVLAASVLITTLVVQFAFINPNLFYGDAIVLSLTDSETGEIQYLSNSAGVVSLVSDKQSAAPLRLMPGTSGRSSGQISANVDTSFEVWHATQGVKLLATCTPTGVSFDQSSASQWMFVSNNAQDSGAASSPTSEAVRNGNDYQVSLVDTSCDMQGCAFVPANVSATNLLCPVVNDSDGEGSDETNTSQLVWRVEKVSNMNGFLT